MQTQSQIVNETITTSNDKTIPNLQNQEKKIEVSNLNQKQNENSNLIIKEVKDEKEISSLQSKYIYFILYFLETNESNLQEQNKEIKQKHYFFASHIPNENKGNSKEQKVSFSVTKKYNHSSNHIEKNPNSNHKIFSSTISNFELYQKNQNKKKFISNNNIPMTSNITMNFPIINQSPISPEEISKKNQEKIGFCYFNEKSFKSLNEPSFLKNNISEQDNNNLNQNNNKNIPNLNNPKNPKFKDNYIDLLVNSADLLIKNGLNLNSLKQYNPSQIEKTSYSYHNHINLKKIPQNNNSQNQNIQNQNNKNQKDPIHKCENKICPVSFNKNSSIHKTKSFSLKNHILNLCNQCYQAYKNGQFCYYCGTIYREYKGKKGFNEHKSWIACDYCKNWEHIQCEEEFGIIPNLSLLIKDHKYKYKCPICRKKDKNYLKHKSSKPQTSDETEEDISSVVKVHKKKKNDYLISSSKKDKNLLNSELYYDIKQIQDLNK